MSGVVGGNIENLTLNNDAYRHVLWTNNNMQLVVMSLQPGETIPMETHQDVTQFIKVERGVALIKIGNKSRVMKRACFIIIPPGANHEVINIGSVNLKLYSLYSPPEHPPNTYQLD